MPSEFENYVLIATYVPNSGDKLKVSLHPDPILLTTQLTHYTPQNMEYKKEWNNAFELYLRELDSGPKPVIWGGDFNCAPTDKDIRHAKPNWNKWVAQPPHTLQSD